LTQLDNSKNTILSDLQMKHDTLINELANLLVQSQSELLYNHKQQEIVINDSLQKMEYSENEIKNALKELKLKINHEQKARFVANFSETMEES
jgi:hypothetical protein